MTMTFSRFSTNGTSSHPHSAHTNAQGAVDQPSQPSQRSGGGRERQRTHYFRSKSGSRQALVATWLNQDPSLAAFAAQAQQDHALRHDCLAVFAQAGLIPSVRPSQKLAGHHDLPIQTSLRGSTLILNTGIAALANKINHLSPRLCAGLVQRGWQVNAIRVKVQPQLNQSHPQKKVAKLSQFGIQSWEASLTGIHDPALAAAIQRLLNHHQKKK